MKRLLFLKTLLKFFKKKRIRNMAGKNSGASFKQKTVLMISVNVLSQRGSCTAVGLHIVNYANPRTGCLKAELPYDKTAKQRDRSCLSAVALALPVSVFVHINRRPISSYSFDSFVCVIAIRATYVSKVV